MEEPIKSGPLKGASIEKEKWDIMLDEYYDCHGWDRITGRQTRDGLSKLGLAGAARRLEHKGGIS